MGKVMKILLPILALCAVALVIGFFAKFTDGFTSDFKSFYVTVDGKDITTTGNGFALSEGSPLVVDVKYVFENAANAENGYSVKVVPNKVEGKDFDFTLDGEPCSYQSEVDLTNGFIVTEGEDNCFTLTPKGESLAEILKAVYPGKTVGDCTDLGYEDMYTLVVTSYNGEQTVRVNFTIAGSVSGVTLDKGVIVF